MKILVLGGAGYIGSHTVYELIDNGAEVVVIDNLETGFMEAVHPNAKLYVGDLRDKEFLDEVLNREKGIDAVIHFAANFQVGESMRNPLKYYDNNLCGTKILLEALVQHGINKIVFSSTAATYGEPENVPIMETDKTEPTNAYGETKLSMEKMFKWVGMGPWQGDMNAVIAECSQYTYLTKGKRVDGTMYSCTSLGVKLGGGLGVAIQGWLLEFAGYDGTLAVQSESAIKMLQTMYLWIPVVITLVITFIMSRMKVEKANAELKL